MNGIGGYFELELSNNKQLYYSNLFAVNTCRNALILLIKTKGYTKVFLPFYICNVIVDTLIKNNIAIEYYQINENLEIAKSLKNKKKEAVLYTNYFGIKDKYIKKISLKYQNLIIDNAQAFFSQPINDTDTIYSPRKFFGVPDGGLLYTKATINLEKYTQDISYSRCSHLLKRIEISPEDGYNDFIKNDNYLSDLSIMRMSKLTTILLSQIDYEKIKKIRKINFMLLHEHLKELNEINIDIDTDSIPMVYPLLLKKGKELKQKLIKNRIFIPTYWPDILEKTQTDSFENNLVNNLLALPIDQRYSEKELDLILNHLT